MHARIFLLAAAFFCALSVPCRSEPAVVTVYSPDLETMNILTRVIDMDSQTSGVLGAIEGAQSQVVDAAEAYPITAVQSVPTLSLLDGVSFNNETAVWTIEFETMQIDSSVPDQINRYVRLLYLTLNKTERSNENTRNPCLCNNTSMHACKDALASDYVLVGEMQSVAALGVQAPKRERDAANFIDNQEVTEGRLQKRHATVQMLLMRLAVIQNHRMLFGNNKGGRQMAVPTFEASWTRRAI